MRRVVVTGLGAVTPLGLDAQTTWDAAVAGTSGVDWIRSFDASDFPVRIASEVKGFEPEAVVGAKDARRLERNVVLAVAASREAWADAGVEGVDPARAGHPRRLGDRRRHGSPRAGRGASRARSRPRLAVVPAERARRLRERARSRSTSAYAARTMRRSPRARPARMQSARAPRRSGGAMRTSSSQAAPRRACTR